MTKNWLKYCFYSSSLCCNNIINGMDAIKNISNIINRTTSKDIEEVKNYNINSERIYNETELIKDISESQVPKDITYEEYFEKKKGKIENKYAHFWKYHNLAADDKFANKTNKYTTNIVEMSDKIKEKDKSNKEASEVKEEDKKKKEALKIKKTIDKNSLEYIEEHILKLGSGNCNTYKFLKDKQKKHNFKLKIDLGEIDLNKKNLEEIALNEINDFKKEKIEIIKYDLGKQLNDLLKKKMDILKDTNSYKLNIDLNFDKCLTYKTQINLNDITTFKDNSDSYEDIKFNEIK